METDGRFLWLGGWTCLDWVNTERVRQGQVVDLISDGKDLLDWMVAANRLQEGERDEIVEVWQRHPEQESASLDASRSFRTVLRQAVQEIVDMGTVSAMALDAINERLRLRSCSYQLRALPDGGFATAFVEEASSGTTSHLVGRLAQTVEEMLCHADLSLIRRCENERCILFFYDTTKNHTRRWCSMSGCGNRAKAAAHYRRTKEARS